MKNNRDERVSQSIKIIVKDRLAEMYARQICPKEKEQAEEIAVTTRCKGSMMAGFSAILEHAFGKQWFFFAFFGAGCDPNDNGWIGYGGFGKTKEDAESQLREFKRWFQRIHNEQGGAAFL